MGLGPRERVFEPRYSEQTPTIINFGGALLFFVYRDTKFESVYKSDVLL